MILAGCGDGCRIVGTRLTLFLVLVGVCAFSEEPKPIRIASFNVYNFRPTHEKPPRDAEGFAATIRALAELDADIVVLQEMGVLGRLSAAAEETAGAGRRLSVSQSGLRGRLHPPRGISLQD